MRAQAVFGFDAHGGKRSTTIKGLARYRSAET
jgi:hypothetical protein